MITKDGFMAPQSTSGTFSFPSTSLTYHNQNHHFKNHCLSVLHSFLSPGDCIIDSGASNHVCSDLALFSEVNYVSSVTVTLPNGLQVSIQHTGSIRINDSLTLINVLHVPDFHFNMISVSSLVKDHLCAAHFFPNGCLIQELSRGLMIRRGRLYNNLYILELTSHTHLSSTHTNLLCGSLLDDGSLWHQRLGHLSEIIQHKRSSFSFVIKSLSSTDKHCNVFPLAKQKRLAYISHNNFSLQPFDFV